MSKVDEVVLLREVGRRIAKLRSDQGRSQEELAGALGVTRACVGHWETGTNSPSLRQLAQLCNVLEVGLERLILGGLPEPSGFSADQLDRMARYVQSLNEIVTSARKRRRGMKEPQPATRKPDAGPRANSGRG